MKQCENQAISHFLIYRFAVGQRFRIEMDLGYICNIETVSDSLK